MTCPVSCITTWFSGQGAPENHLVQKIPELVLRAGQPDLPFFFSWANEPWTRRWTGLEDVLTAQTYGDEQESRQHFQFLLSFFRRPKYLRINGAAVFATDLVTTWHGLEEGVRRQLARQDGFHEHLLQTIGTSYHVDRQPPDSVTGERGLLSAGTNNGVNGVKAAPKRVLRSPGLAGVTRCGDPDAEVVTTPRTRLGALGIQSYLLRYGDWRHCYVGARRVQIPSEKVLGALGIFMGPGIFTFHLSSTS